MTDANQKQLGKTLWAIADQLRGAMDADDFREEVARSIWTV
jgi:type I restriction enzyme M protein